MNWIDYTFLFGGLTALIFNLVIFCLSFKREFPKVTQRITILFAGFGLGVGLYSIYKIVQTASTLSTGIVQVLIFITWIIMFLLAITTGIVHLIRILSKKRKLYLLSENKYSGTGSQYSLIQKIELPNKSINKFYKLDLFDNYTNLEFNKINILKQGVLTPCRDKKT